ncbi:hypothetical protein HPL003_14920 [Paenibacillus terrae HPL-003]|uniref:Uncharacterized protein n=1 Tax=Paenibacillus terrae (strain HPL-003) TaxID=985665 RepID=G7W497_PAETH|nr:hypothetical protein [Paenibacillus terrae]AET59735.1 hypothetical protein HPL003_14920 [Paenibacillus terrae HPL-003]
MGNLETDVLAELQAFIQTLKHPSREKRQGLDVRFERLEEHKRTLSTFLNFRTRPEANQQEPDQLSAVPSQSMQHEMNGKAELQALPMNENVSKLQRAQSWKSLNDDTADVRAGTMEYIRMRRHQAQDLQSVLSYQRIFHMRPEASCKFQEQYSEWRGQSLQTQLGIWAGMESLAGTFHMPGGVTELTQNEYLTRTNVQPSYTINSGDVVVHMTLPNVTNNVSPTQLETMGNRLGRGLKNGRVGSLRDQLLMNPTTAYRSSTSY